MNIRKEQIINIFEKYLQVENSTTCINELSVSDKPCSLLDEFEEKLRVYLSNMLDENVFNIEEITYNYMNDLCSYKKYSKEKRTKYLKYLLQFDKIMSRYDNLMNSLCFEGSKVNNLLEEKNEIITIKNLVEECKYCLSLYYEEGNSRSREENDTNWLSETNKLKRFINRYDI